MPYSGPELVSDVHCTNENKVGVSTRVDDEARAISRTVPYQGEAEEEARTYQAGEVEKVHAATRDLALERLGERRERIVVRIRKRLELRQRGTLLSLVVRGRDRIVSDGSEVHLRNPDDEKVVTVRFSVILRVGRQHQPLNAPRTSFCRGRTHAWTVESVLMLRIALMSA